MTDTRDVAVQMLIRRYIQPSSGYTSQSRGPDQFPSEVPLHGPMSWHRLRVYQDALGIVEYDEQAAYPALNLSVYDEELLREQCAFISEHTKPLKPWTLPANPFLGDAT